MIKTVYPSETANAIRDCTRSSTAQVQVEHKVATPPQILYHGTAERSVPSILEQGLHSASRHFCPLSADAETAVKVGSRHGKPVVLTIDTVAMLAAGHQFYLADNGVWLTETFRRNLSANFKTSAV